MDPGRSATSSSGRAPSLPHCRTMSDVPSTWTKRRVPASFGGGGAGANPAAQALSKSPIAVNRSASVSRWISALSGSE